MFTEARIKLTGWYLLMIMTVSLIFSVAIYRVVMTEIETSFRRAEVKMRIPELGISLPVPKSLLLDDLEFARGRLLNRLLVINGLIFLGSAAAGYFLAGKTLSPIQQALDEQKRFVADASHELKTPLTALKTSVEVALRDMKLTKTEARQVLQKSLEEVEELSNLSENLLSLSRLEKNQEIIEYYLLDTSEIFSRLKKVFGRLADRKKIKLIFPDTNIQFKGNEEGITKILTILIDNAIKYSLPEGSVTVSTWKERKNIAISVADTGIGISKSDITHIFDRFYRADTSRNKTKVTGFGLGLSIATELVEKCNGSLKVKSQEGKGSTFTVRLPFS